MCQFKVGDLVEVDYQYTGIVPDNNLYFFWQGDDGKRGIKYYGKILEIRGGGSWINLELHLPDGSLYYPAGRAADYENACWAFSASKLIPRGAVLDPLPEGIDYNDLLPEALTQRV